MLKQSRLTLKEAHKGLAIFEGIPIQFAKPDFAHALKIAHQSKLYAYDAYFLDCAIRHNASLMTLDRKLMMAAKTLNVTFWRFEMQVYTYSEARQKLAEVLEQAESSGKVVIRRKDGRTFALVPEKKPLLSNRRTLG